MACFRVKNRAYIYLLLSLMCLGLFIGGIVINVKMSSNESATTGGSFIIALGFAGILLFLTLFFTGDDAEHDKNLKNNILYTFLPLPTGYCR